MLIGYDTAAVCNAPPITLVKLSESKGRERGLQGLCVWQGGTVLDKRRVAQKSTTKIREHTFIYFTRWSAA